MWNDEFKSALSTNKIKCKNMWDGNGLRKPKHYDDYIVVAGAFIADFEEPMSATYEKAIQ